MKQKMKLIVTLVLVLSMVTPSYASIQMDTLSGHWAHETISRWYDEGLVEGFNGENFNPDASITRAEFFSLIENVIDLQTSEAIPFTDVSENDWYADAVKSAYELGLAGGYPDGTFRPDNKITREETAVIISKLLSLSKPKDLSVLESFIDFDDTDEWNQLALGSMVVKGLFSGYPDHSLRSNNQLTQAEAVVLLDKVFGKRYTNAGTYGGETRDNLLTIEGNVTINAADVTLKNMIVKGDIFVTEHVGDGEVYLDNVTIEGDTIVKGGGENSVYFKDVNIKGALLVKKTNNKVRIVASGNTKVSVTLLESGAILLEQELEGGGFEAVEIPAEAVQGANIVLNGQFDTVSVDAPNVGIELSANSKVNKLIANEEAENLKLTGKGSIAEAEINGDHTTIDVEVDNLDKKEGIDVSVGETKPTPSTKPDKKKLWTMTWNDEFNGTEIDDSKWTYDIGNWIVDGNGDGVTPGWGNNEKEYYTNSSNNAYLEDGKLVIKALKEETTDDYGTYDYTSAKLLTRGLFSQTYGKYEIRAKLPTGKGLWPAIWMLPADDVYGGWAASGELDIMEGWGSRPQTVAGTIHYGELWPNNKYSGHEYEFDQTTSVNDFHTYAIEWEPGEIRWYVDGSLYQTQNNWSARDGNDEKFAFPAPFDQDFYMILNLAVGGNFDGDPTEETLFPSTMEVDYVRVYELTGRDYMTPVEPSTDAEPLPEDAKVPDSEGNYISNGDFSEPIQDNFEALLDFSDDWNLVQMAEFGGSASQSIDTIDGENYAKVDITNGGSQNYSVQLIQLTTLGKGRFYEVSFDAKAANSRTMSMKMSAGAERGWTTYSDNYSFDLSDTFETYTEVFQMAADTDTAARLELNLGLNTNSVWIGNVSVKEIPEPQVDYNASKAPLPDGNGIYNGTFDKETIDRLAYWNLSNTDAESTYSVSESTRILKVAITDGGTTSSAVTLNQKGIQLEENTEYAFTFEGKADLARSIEIAFADADGVLYTEPQFFDLTEEMASYDFSFKMESPVDLNAVLLVQMGGNDADVYLDNMSLKATSIDYSGIDVFPLENGDFSDGLTGWNNYIHNDAAGTITEEDGAAKIAIDAVGAETWGIQFFQGPFDFSNKVEYKVAFDVKSDVDRNLEIVLDNPSYTRYLSETVSSTGDYTHYEYTLKLVAEDTVTLKFLLGRTDADVPVGAHTIYIDNVVCEVKDAPKDANLIIKNGTFDTNTDKWTLYTEDGSDGTMNAVNEELKIDFSAYAGWFKWSTQVYQDIIKLESDKDYILSFDARSTLDREILVQMTDMPESVVALTGDMTNYTFEFTASETIEDGKLNFLLGTDNMDGADFIAHSILIDNVSIVEAPPAPPLPPTTTITNGFFDTDSQGWTLYTADGSDGIVSVDNGQVSVDFAGYAGWFKWSTQFYQEDLILEAGKSYELRFDASSTIDRTIGLELDNLNPKEVYLTNSMKTYSYIFTAQSNISTGKLNFLLGTDNMDGADFIAHSITLDNIEINPLIVDNGYGDVEDLGWSLYTSDGSSAVMSTTDSALQVEFAGYAGWQPWSTQVFQEGINLEAGQSYELSFVVQSTTNSVIWVELNGIPQQEVSVDILPQRVTYTFTVVDAVENGKLNFLMGTQNQDGAKAIPHTISLDNIQIMPLVVNNGEFDKGTQGWMNYTADGSDADMTQVDNTLVVDFPNYAGWFKWSTQVSQEGLELRAGKHYTLVFDAKATIDREAWLEIPGLTTTSFNLTTSMKTYVIDFTAPETTEDGKLVFLLGTDNLDGALFTPHSVTFDNIAIVNAMPK